jgi:hypothetical protein
MADDPNTVQVLAPQELQIARSQHLAVAVQMATVEKALVALGTVPDFGDAPEPVQDGTTYQATDGTAYYRPVLRVADRQPGMLAGPDVWFLKDDQGTIALHWTLADVPPAGAPAGARPLPFTITGVRLAWDDGSRAFDLPATDPSETAGDGKPAFLLRGGATLTQPEATQMEAAMSRADSGCRLEVDYTYSYKVAQEFVPSPIVTGTPWVPVEVPVEVPKPGPDPILFARTPGRITAFRPVDLAGVRPIKRLVRVHPPAEAAGSVVAAVPLRPDTPIASAVRIPASRIVLRPELVEALGKRRVSDVVETPHPREPDQRTVSVTRTVPFVFNPNDEANRPIYRSLHGVANLTGQWRESAAGWLRDSEFPNTVYRIPDEIRLAFDPDLGTPHVITTLHKDEQQHSSVRVLMRLAPWQDPRKIVETRKLVGSEAAQVIVGPVESTSLRMGGSFPEAMKILGADSVSISLSNGADLLLELSLEYFQLLCGMLGGAVGLPGELDVTLGHPAAADGGPPPAPVTVPVNVRLRMDRVHDLPVSVQAPPDRLSPTSVTVTNRANTAIRIGGCEAVFLQMDDNSVVPLGSHEARCTSTFPVELPAGGSTELAFEAVDPKPEDFWNAVLVELLDKAMVDDAKTTLLKANELAGSGELTWDLTISSPVFTAAELPARWVNLSAIEVEISAPGFDTSTVVLRKDTPSKSITMRRPLADLIAGEAAGIHTATYRVRNDYVDHQGEWSAPQQQSGEELIVYPNAAPDG